MYKLGSNVWFIDLKSKSVLKGIVVEHTISQGGYSLYVIQTQAGSHRKECAYVFDDIEDAKASMDVFQPIHDKMVEIDKESVDEMNRLRKTIIGEPDFPDFAVKKGV